MPQGVSIEGLSIGSPGLYMLFYMFDPESRLCAGIRHRGDRGMIDAVLFDLDGTLLNRAETYRGFIERQFGRFADILGSVDREEYVRRVVEFDSNGYVAHRDTFARVEATFSLSEGSAEALLSDFDAHFPDECIPIHGASTILEDLRSRGIRTGLITNGSSLRQRRKIALMEIEGLLDAITISEEVGVRKPSPEIFHLTLDQLGVEPTRAAYVGDTPDADIRGPRNCGMLALWKTSPFWPEPSIADGIIDVLDEVLRFLGSASGESRAT